MTLIVFGLYAVYPDSKIKNVLKTFTENSTKKVRKFTFKKYFQYNVLKIIY